MDEPKRGDALTHPNHVHFIHIEAMIKRLGNGRFIVSTMPGYICVCERDSAFDNPSRKAWRFVPISIPEGYLND